MEGTHTVIRSMTGFGFGQAGDDQFAVQSELRCVNHKQLSLEVNLSQVLLPLEPKTVQLLENLFVRGRVHLNVRVVPGSSSLEKLSINESLVREAIRAWRSLARAEGLTAEPSLATILQIPGVLTRVQDSLDTEKAWSVLRDSIQKAADGASAMRETEGARLYSGILDLVDQISEIAKVLEDRASRERHAAQVSIQKKLKALLVDVELNPALVMNEVAILASKADISEEIKRIQSHLSAARSVKDHASTSPGRRLDFLAQEIQREASTLAAKANLWGVADETVQLRILADSIRQQTANLE